MTGIVHVHGFLDGQREQQHGDDGRNRTEPAEADEVDIFLVARSETAAGVGTE